MWYLLEDGNDYALDRAESLEKQNRKQRKILTSQKFLSMTMMEN